MKINFHSNQISAFPRYYFLLFLSILILPSLAAFAQSTGITLEDIWASPKFASRGAEAIRWMKDDTQYSRLERTEAGLELNVYNVISGEKTETLLRESELIPSKDASAIQIQDYAFSPDEAKILFSTEMEALYRHSYAEVAYVFHRDTRKLMALHGGKPIYSPTFSPDGKQIAFVYENNLYVSDVLGNNSVQITRDGKKNAIIHGMCDWVYEEEFAFTRAFEWSHDGQFLAWIRFDETRVPEFGMDMYQQQLYPNRQTFKYPKAGEQNAEVSVHIYDIKKKKTVRVQTGEETDIYLPRIRWTHTAGKLMVLRMNRLQNTLDFLLADSKSGASTLLLQEKSSTYVDIHESSHDNLYFLKDGKQFIWLSEKDGYNHIYLYSMENGAERKVTSGNWDVTDFYGVDEGRGIIYFAAADRNPMERHLFRVSIDGGILTGMSKERGTHTAAFSTGFNFYVHQHSAHDSPQRVVLRDREGKEVKVLEDNAALRKRLSEMTLHTRRYIKVPGADGQELNAWIFEPRNMDPARKYPVLMYVYGGPGSQTVKDAWEGANAFWYQMLADKGYIVMSVDNRGTGYRGTSFKNCTYKQLGKLEAEDQIAAGKWVSQQSWADPERIGIWGWSFGGYVTALCLTKGEGVFKAGISVAPVTNWKFYDTIYTERFLQTPQLNPSGYEDNSPVNYAKGLQGRYLLIHGSADDNVHVQNSMEFVNSLVRNGKAFDMFIYPDRNHSIYGPGVRMHLYRKMTRFIEEQL